MQESVVQMTENIRYNNFLKVIERKVTNINLYVANLIVRLNRTCDFVMLEEAKVMRANRK